MNTTYKVLIGVVIGLLVATGAGFLIARNTITTSSLGGVVGVGQVQTNTFWFVNGLFAGTSQQWSVSSAGAITTTGGMTVGSSGTKVSNFQCATATWNPGALGTSTISNATSVDIALPGAVVGDLCSGSLTSATSTAIAVDCSVAQTATGTLQLTNLGTTNASIDLATGTAKVCYTH